MPERALPQDPYIDAVTATLAAAGLTPTDSWTSDSETVGIYCYLNAVLTLDPSNTHDTPREDVPDDAAWPHGLLLVWEWHSGREEGGPERGALWQFAERKADGSNEYPTWLPVDGTASPEAIVDAARKVIDHDIKAGHFYNGGMPSGAFETDSRRWTDTDQLEAAASAWATKDAEG
ncbi:hypothetical protein [Streptomyces scabiei]|uniref:hypothetical protein n=1 Tax=Streptomyces scabiei TaxID=1930 RepID=UPI0029B85535|nr:hypothetical protein [Streptomyces scabiei]MDX3202090.1 hypothetical protein [Streptomyces scabiei]MDX3217703.1 hypothetical protein [Streptomyces scabiei]